MQQLNNIRQLLTIWKTTQQSGRREQLKDMSLHLSNRSVAHADQLVMARECDPFAGHPEDLQINSVCLPQPPDISVERCSVRLEFSGRINQFRDLLGVVFSGQFITDRFDAECFCIAAVDSVNLACFFN